ncbi:membrane protein [Balneicella halophila]|uniref:Membrane protein n=1 Tax=Balneicella halophila TaxID=1537566 RepID=A0A7L4URJ8_BALHA|nr:YihY/virulence factor BrkB family protein [Balneicella halophila]PVX52370.1 membrane protein [Balneicella halophila]
MLKILTNNRIVNYLKRISLPGFEDIPVWNIILFFWNGLINGAITTRASAIAFSFFIALFPLLLFLFSLIPYVPIDNFQEELLGLLIDVMPRNAFLATRDTISDIVLRERFDLLSIGFISMLAFATNGVNSLMTAFAATYHSFKGRNWINQYLVSMLLVCILSVLIITAVVLTVSGRSLIKIFNQRDVLTNDINYFVLVVGQWLIIILLFFTAVAIIYYFAPSKRGKFRLFSAGTTLATLLMLISSWGFSYYINNFGQYNKLYGSIGTVIVILLWLYFNALSLLIGFELNISISNARKQELDLNKEGVLIES